MKRFLGLGVGLIVCLVVPSGMAVAQEVVEVSTLLAQPDRYDQRIVTIRGEIVGDYGDRGDSVWVQVNDDPYVDQPSAVDGLLAGTNTGLSVLLPGDVDTFGRPGGFGVRGPIVEITGVFRDLDPALGGLTFVEATEVVLLSPSQPLPEPGADIGAAVAGAALTILGLLAMAHRRDLLRRVARS